MQVEVRCPRNWNYKLILLSQVHWLCSKYGKPDMTLLERDEEDAFFQRAVEEN